MGMGKTTANTGGSMKFGKTKPTTKMGNSGISAGAADVKALGKASGGRIESRPGKPMKGMKGA